MGSCTSSLSSSSEGKVLSAGDVFDVITAYSPQRASLNMNMNNFHAVSIKGFLDEARLRQAVDELQRRHPRMRAKLYMNQWTKYNYLLETEEPIPLVMQMGTYDSINTDLEQILLREIDAFRGPMCHVTYVKHPDGTGLLVFGNNHGVGDGRCCETVLAQLLLLYDGRGAEVPFGKLCGSFSALMSRPPRKAKLDAWHEIDAQMPVRERDSLTESFVDPTHAEYEARFEGVALEFCRMDREQTAQLLATCRRQGTTVTAAVAAAAKFAVLAELLERGRRAEFLQVGVDINLRGRTLGPEYAEECGAFAVDVQLRLGLEEDFWSCARRFGSLLKRVVEEDCFVEASQLSFGDLLTLEGAMLQKELPEEALAMAQAGMEHCNFSSLGVLKRFGQYKDLEVLENFTASNIGFLGCKVNACTSGSSGRMTVSVMVAKNVVPRSRELARSLAGGIGRTLQDLAAGGGSEQRALAECRRVAARMGASVSARRRELEAKRQAGGAARGLEIFQGDVSGRQSWRSHAKILVNVVGTMLASGVLMGYPLYQQDLKDAGVFNHVCPRDVHTCDEQDEPLKNLYSVNVYITSMVFLVMGLWFDFLGPRTSASLGGLMSTLGIFGLGFASSLNARRWPIMQTTLMYCSAVVADGGGFAASMSLIGWLWHYPRRQTFLIGLSQGSQQCSLVMGVLVHGLVERGYSLSTTFYLLSLTGLAGTVLMFCSVPSQAEFYEEAGRVLNLRPQSLVAPRPSRWSLVFQFRTMWNCLGVFPLHNGLIFTSTATGMVGALLWVASWSAKYREWFSPEDVGVLTLVFETVPAVGAIALNPLSGMLMDVIGLPRFTLIVCLAAVGMTCTELVRSLGGQVAFMCFWAVYLGTQMNVSGKWPVYFTPPTCFGVTQGCISAFSGVLGLLIVALSQALRVQGDGLVFLLLLISSASFLSTAWLLLRFGLPKQPPRSKYDSADRLLWSQYTKLRGSQQTEPLLSDSCTQSESESEESSE